MNKLTLGCGTDVRFHDYLNVDDQPNPNCPGGMFQQGDLANLDWLCDDGTVEEILALNTLARFAIAQVKDVLANWAKKLAPGGVLKLSFLDLVWVANGLASEALDITQANSVIFHSKARCGLDDATVKNCLTALGLAVGNVRCQDYTVYVEATKAVQR